MPVAAIYARKSNKETHATREVLSTTRQIEQARAYAARKGWAVDERHIYRDEAITGAEFVKRRQFTRLLAAVYEAKTPPFDILIIWERERLGRDLFRGPSTMHDLWEAGVRIFCFATDEEIKFDTPEEGLVEQIHGYRAEAEIRKVRERVLSVRSDKLGRGHVVGGRVYGYVNVAYYGHAGCTGHVERAGLPPRARCPVAPERGEKRVRVLREIEPTEAAIVRQIFALRAAGDGYKTIGRALNREGVKSASGHSWGKAVIRQMLHQEHYRGLVVDGKTRWVKRRGTKSRIHCPEGEWRRYDAPGPALIPGELWEAVQRVGGISRVQFGRGPGGSREDSPERAPYLLTGFTQCATCGHSLTIKKHPRSGRAAYKCSWNNERGQAGCANGASVPVQAAEEAVLNTLIGDVLDPAMIIRYLDDVRAQVLEDAATPEGGADRARLTAEIARLDREIGHLVALAAQGSTAVLQGDPGAGGRAGPASGHARPPDPHGAGARSRGARSGAPGPV